MLNTDELITRFKENGLAPFEGARIDAEIPITESLINEMAAEQAKSNESLESLRIQLPGDNLIAVYAKAKVSAGLFGIKVPVNKKLLFQVDREVSLSPSPTVRLHIIEGLSGLEKTLLGWLENLISRMVPGEISMSHDVLSIDLGPEIKKKEMEFLVENLQKVIIEGHPGKLIIKVRSAV